MLNLKTLVSGLALAASFASFNAVAADDWHRSTGGVPPQAIGDEFYARGTGGVSPAIADDFFARGTGGVTPNVISDEFHSRGTGGVSPQAQAE
jgi:hypothetical protein